MSDIVDILKKDIPEIVEGYIPAVKETNITEITNNNEVNSLKFNIIFDQDKILKLEKETEELYNKYNGRIPITEYSFYLKEDLNDLIFYLEDEYPEELYDKIEVNCESIFGIEFNVEINIKKRSKKAMKMKRFIRNAEYVPSKADVLVHLHTMIEDAKVHNNRIRDIDVQTFVYSPGVPLPEDVFNFAVKKLAEQGIEVIKRESVNPTEWYEEERKASEERLKKYQEE